MKPRLRVAILVESTSVFWRNLLHGIAAYAQTYGPWAFFYGERAMDAPIPARLADWRADGLLVRIADTRIARQVRRLRLPTINLREEPVGREIPYVGSDAAGIVRLAVDHLTERGLRSLAFVGFENVTFSESRCKHFLAYSKLKGLKAAVFNNRDFKPERGSSHVSEDALAHSATLAQWLSDLAKPVGILACNDMRAQQVLNVCGEQDIAVPDQVAVVGVDNDPILCQLSDPPMSSVDPNAQKIGYEAAGLLHRMLSGADDIPQVLMIEPAGVVVRRSTDVLAIPDAGPVEAVRYVREHACEGLVMDDVVQQIAVSRGTLIRWFMKHLGHSPSEEVTRVPAGAGQGTSEDLRPGH